MCKGLTIGCTKTVKIKCPTTATKVAFPTDTDLDGQQILGVSIRRQDGSASLLDNDGTALVSDTTFNAAHITFANKGNNAPIPDFPASYLAYTDTSDLYTSIDSLNQIDMNKCSVLFKAVGSDAGKTLEVTFHYKCPTKTSC